MVTGNPRRRRSSRARARRFRQRPGGVLLGNLRSRRSEPMRIVVRQGKAMPYESILDQARRHVAEAASRIEEQERRIEDMLREGHDTTEAERLLENFIETLRVMQDHLT